MRILIGIATYPTHPNLYPQTADSIEALRQHGWDDRLVVEEYGDDDPAKSGIDNLTDKHNRMRQDVLDGDYDALLTIEADMIVPPDALGRLAAVDADVVYGTYVSRHHPMVLCFPQVKGYTGRSISADPHLWREHWGRVIRSEGVGFGCTLIRRNVLERVEFRRDELGRKRAFADDWTFALDVQAAGFKSAHDLGLLCGHIRHDGTVLWPDVTQPRLFRVEGEAQPPAPKVPPAPAGTYRVRRPIWHAGQRRYYQPGETIELEAGPAGILLDKRAVEPLEPVEEIQSWHR